MNYSSMLPLFAILSARKGDQKEVVNQLLPQVALNDPQQQKMFASISVPQNVRSQHNREETIVGQAVDIVIPPIQNSVSAIVTAAANPAATAASDLDLGLIPEALRRVIERNPAVGEKLAQAQANVDKKALEAEADTAVEVYNFIELIVTKVQAGTALEFTEEEAKQHAPRLQAALLRRNINLVGPYTKSTS